MSNGDVDVGPATIAVVYLARMAEGIEPLQRFAASYVRFPAGIAHDLIIVYKGFRTRQQLDAAKAVFASIPHSAIEIDDSGFDINAYFRAARQIPHDYVSFLNTFSQIAAAGWLAMLYKHAALPDVGMAGASGSYESLHDSIALAHKIDWLCNAKHVPYDPGLEYFYGHVINVSCRAWKTLYKGRSLPVPLRRMLRAGHTFWRLRNRALSDLANALVVRLKLRLLRLKDRAMGKGAQLPVDSQPLSEDEHFSFLWNRFTGPHGHLQEYLKFPVFPNPHLRSNAFMLSRRRFLELKGAEALTKWQAYAFESGLDSATSQIRALGLRAVVVNRFGEGFDVADWSRSRTFRLGDQDGLMVHDNQSLTFMDMTPGSQTTYRRMTWGDYLGDNPPERPDLGFKFAVAPFSSPDTYGNG